MKITKKQLKNTLSVLKTVESKEQIVSLEVKEGVLNFYSRSEGMILKLKNIKTEEKDTEKITVKKDFFNKIEKQNPEEFELKINKKTISSKVNGISFSTALLDEGMDILIEEEENIEATKIMIDSVIMKSLNEALTFVDRDSKMMLLQGINLSLKDGLLRIAATDKIKMYLKTVETNVEGEFEVTIRPETIPFLSAIFDSTDQRAFPILISDQAIYIKSKGMFFKSSLFAGNYPSITPVVEKIKAKETVYTGKLNEELHKKVKAIEIKTNILSIKKEEGEMTFTTKTEINENSFKIKSDGEETFEKKVNYQNFLLVSSIINDFEIKEDCMIFEKENLILLVMLLREQ